MISNFKLSPPVCSALNRFTLRHRSGCRESGRM
nr:MAG TPA: hypothetical protein [Caudoviricetes sp.]